jgi:imidazolonepropionase-like amidohydrolase
MAANDAVADHTFAEWSLFLISRLQANGVPVGAGTDTPIGLGIPGYSLHTELELLVRAGLSTREALYAATITPAEFFDIQDQVGRIDAGMRADLVLLTADPLRQISNTRKIAKVMVGGHWVEPPSGATVTETAHRPSGAGPAR